MKLYQYAVLWRPNEAQRKEGKTDLILVDVTSTLQKDEAAVKIEAARKIPQDYADQPSQVEILVHSF